MKTKTETKKRLDSLYPGDRIQLTEAGPIWTITRFDYLGNACYLEKENGVAAVHPSFKVVCIIP